MNCRPTTTLTFAVALLMTAPAIAAERLIRRASVCAAGMARLDPIVEISLADPSQGAIVAVRDGTRDLPFQADATPGGVLVTALLNGELADDECRNLELLAGTSPAHAATPLVSVSELDDYQGEPAFEIKTPRATYVYHKRGSGFASLIDGGGNDWISYRPEGGFAGSYRGIPNIAPPDFHPGRPAGKQTSRLLGSGPLRATIVSQTEDGQWRAIWDIFPTYARMTLEAKGPDPYWVLYEGTPGGQFDPETDFWRDSTGREMPMPADPERWNGRLPDPQWALFGDRELDRGLFLALDQSDSHWDEFWHRGAGGMTVFGFGRGPKPQWQYLDSAPMQLTIGLVDDTSHEAVRAAVASATQPLTVTLSPAPL